MLILRLHQAFQCIHTWNYMHDILARKLLIMCGCFSYTRPSNLENIWLFLFENDREYLVSHCDFRMVVQLFDNVFHDLITTNTHFLIWYLACTMLMRVVRETVEHMP